MPAIPPAPIRLLPCWVWDVGNLLSWARVASTTCAATVNGEQLFKEQGSLVCVSGWKKSYADGENAMGFSLDNPWGALSWALTMDRIVREEKKSTKEETAWDMFFFFLSASSLFSDCFLLKCLAFWVGFYKVLGSDCCLESNFCDEREGTEWWRI